MEPVNEALARRLAEFANKNQMSGKGPLSVALYVTSRASRDGLPINYKTLLSGSQSQVAGLNKTSVQAILKKHGIDRVLAEEAGRTSRGSVGNMKVYVAFLNKLHKEGEADLEAIEEWWAQQVRLFFSGKPFVLHVDTSKSLRAAIRDLLDQADKRQRESSGTMYVGTVIQHLVGAKLDIVLGGIAHYGASVADEGSGRDADFIVGDTAVHVSTAPGEALIRKCMRNLASGLRPIVVTTEKGIGAAQIHAEQQGIGDRIDVLDVEQFISGNIHEHGHFDADGRRVAVERLVAKYNEVVTKHETDPSLLINLGK
jgi:hypothetical protein